VKRPSPVLLFVARELTRAARRPTISLARFAVTAVLLALLYSRFARVGFDASHSPQMVQRLGQVVASWSAMLAWFFLAVALPPMIASAVQEESERSRGDLLTLAGVPPIAVQLGAASARSATALVVLLALLPAVALASSFGGVNPVADGLTVGMHLGAVTLEVALLSAWLGGVTKGPLPVALLAWTWLGLMAVPLPAMFFEAGFPVDVVKLVSGPLSLNDMYGGYWSNSGASVQMDLFVPLVHGPVIAAFVLGPRVGPLLSVPLCLLFGAGGALVSVGAEMTGGLPGLAAMGLVLGTGAGLFGTVSVTLLRWWSSRGTATPSVRVSPKAARRWTDHIWDDPVAWRETATNAYGVVNRVIGRAYIVAGVLALGALAVSAGDWAELDQTFFALGAMGLITAVAVTVLASAASILEERRSDALELLLLSRMGPKGILRGKSRAALLLAGPAACVAILGLPAYLGSLRPHKLAGWGGEDLLSLVGSYVVWVPALLFALAALVRFLSLGARTAGAAWLRVATLVVLTIGVPWIVQLTRPRYLRRRGLRSLGTTLSELVLPYMADLAPSARWGSALAWLVVGVIATALARRRLERGRWRR